MAKLRALAAAFALLIGSIAAPIALAGNSPDVCAMACCVEEGHCCCSPRRALVAGQNSDGKPSLNEAEIFAACPEGCANATTSSNLLMRVAARAPGIPAVFFSQAPIRYEQRASDHIFIDLGSSPLRGPPCRFTPDA
jgi:hypothetical protein